MTQHRRNQILDLVKSDGTAHVTELARKFGVSTVTIRNDLAESAKDGRAPARSRRRDRGAGLASDHSLPGLQERSTLNLEAKQRIGKAAAQLVQPGTPSSWTPERRSSKWRSISPASPR